MTAMQGIRSFFRLPDLRRKVLVVLGLVVLARIFALLPIPGVDATQLQLFLQQNQAIGLLNVFTGGGLSNFSIGLLGVGPFITASIVVQLLTPVIPTLDNLNKEGELGRRKISQYTRLLSVPLGVVQALSTLTLLKNQQLIPAWSGAELLFLIGVALAGSIFLMWIGELISEQGIGNGLSILVAVSIISVFPQYLVQAWTQYTAPGVPLADYAQLAGFTALALVMLAVIVLVNEGTRNLAVRYARRASAGRTTSTVDSFLPIKVNAAGVIPIIFAVSLVLVPTVAARFLENARSETARNVGQALTEFFANQWANTAVLFVAVIFFTFFYTFLVFRPKELAENLQRQSGYFPGIRPGEDTEKYLADVLARLTFPSALFLALIAVLPFLAQQGTGVTSLSLGGTSLLIVVSVVLEILRQARAQVQSRTYDTYLR